VLSEKSEEYASVARQAGSPAVLAICRGRGMAVDSGSRITEEYLLKAFVEASRPPSEAGASGSKQGAPGQL